ncbi:MAG: formylmethanofuran dehydrogenase subunit C [Gemmatimonadales bacterium]
MSDGLVARLRSRLEPQADLGDVLTGEWWSLTAADFARRPIHVAGSGVAAVGDLFEMTGTPAGGIRFEGDLSHGTRLGAGLAGGAVVVAGNIGREVGLGMSAGSIDVHGDAGPKAGGAAPEARRGMIGGELIIRGSAGEECGSRMRRGLVVVCRDAGARAGLGMLAGTVIVLGNAGSSAGLWSKRGSIVVLGAVTVPSTYTYACTFKPEYLRFILGRLRSRYGLAVEERHISGAYRRYSGDLADLGKGEILAWTAQ